MIHRPRKWAYLVAVGPASIAIGVLAFAFAISASTGGPELLLLWLILSVISVPAVTLGTWLDSGVVEKHTGVGQRRAVWLLFSLLFAPLTGTIYLLSRRKYFRRKQVASMGAE